MKSLVAFKNRHSDGEWIIGGDFNVVSSNLERKDRAVIDRNLDVSSKGKIFTWFSGDGNAMSRIDRFIISHIIAKRWEWWVKE